MKNFKKISKFVLVVLTLYIFTSIGEWLIHKYIMHSNYLNNHNYSNHIRHHYDVNYNMSLSNHVEDDLYFSINYTFMVLLLIFPIYYIIINKAFKYKKSLTFIFILSLIITILYVVSWNYLHPLFHMMSEVPYDNWTNFEKKLFHNHAYHHLQKGDIKGNYCIVFLGADHLFGTYNNCINNKEYCEKNYDNLSKETKELYDMEKQNKKLKYGLKFYSQ
tara:strand:- start:46 stop:699 length:654 start_codon:yes stop_codon:yes gene_type:complete